MRQPQEYKYWAAALIVFGTISLATGLVRISDFWSGYVLDIFGPAWNYILFRGLFSESQPAMLSRFLKPEAAVVLIAALCFLIEATQYLDWYESHYDPFDFIAYVALLIPCYVADRLLSNRRSKYASV